MVDSVTYIISTISLIKGWNQPSTVITFRPIGSMKFSLPLYRRAISLICFAEIVPEPGIFQVVPYVFGRLANRIIALAASGV